MEYSGVSREKEIFVPRKSKEEFFRDGEVIKDLYYWTYELLTCERNSSSHEFTLDVFNHAYCICWMFINGKGSIRQIADCIAFETEVVRLHSWAVAYTLFRLHKKFYPLTSGTRMDIALMLPESFYRNRYSPFIGNRSLSEPIYFRTSFPVLPQHEEIDFAEAKDYMLAVMDKAMKFEEDNKMLRSQLEVVHKESSLDKNLIRELQEQNALLKQKVNKLENDELCKVVNLETITKYGLRQTEPQIVQDIVNMLSRLCIDKRCIPEPLQARIKDLEDHIIELKKPRPVTQHNHGCQNFYGNITDSDFHS